MTTSPVTFLETSPELKAAMHEHILGRMVPALVGSNVDLRQIEAVAEELYRLGHGSAEIAMLMDDAQQLAIESRRAALN